MKIKTTRDETTRTITFHVQDGPVLESWVNQYSSRAKRFQVERGRIYLVEGVIRNVSVAGKTGKVDVFAASRWSGHELDELPDWLSVVVTEAVRQVAQEWELQP